MSYYWATYPFRNFHYRTPFLFTFYRHSNNLLHGNMLYKAYSVNIGCLRYHCHGCCCCCCHVRSAELWRRRANGLHCAQCGGRGAREE